jgi:ABC-type dipeptide/oligopeptide/nickel transport system permease subunit
VTVLEATGLRRRELPAGLDAGLLAARHHLLRRPGVLAGSGLLLAVTAFCVVVPLLRGVSADDQTGPQFAAPGPDWPLGTDQRGGDLLARIAAGGLRSLGGATAVVVVCLVVGLFLGLVAAAAPRWLDTVMMRAVDVLNGFPPLLVPVVVVAVLGTGFARLLLAVAVSYAPSYVRLCRTFARSVVDRPDVVVAGLFGIGRARILATHVLPTVGLQLAVIASLDFGSVVITLSSLSYLGLGAQAPTPEWGVLLGDGQTYFSAAPWLLVVPTAAIALVTTAANLVGESVRDALEAGGPA